MFENKFILKLKMYLKPHILISILLVLLIMSCNSNSKIEFTNWVKNVKHKVETIDKKATLIKSDRKSDEKSITTYTISKFNNNTKTEFKTLSKSNELSSFEMTYKVYQSQDFIIFTNIIIKMAFFYKGAYDTIRPISQLTERLVYFNTDSSGIAYLRKVAIYENQDLDSLKLQFFKKPFALDTILTAEDYINERQLFHKFKEQLY